MKIVATIFDPS